MNAHWQNFFVYQENRISDEELLAFVLEGRFLSKKFTNSINLASSLLQQYGNLGALRRTSPHELSETAGISLLQACTIIAALELGARSYCFHEPFFPINCPQDVYEYYAPKLSHLSHERFHVLNLDARHYVIRDSLVSIGNSASCSLDIKDALVDAIRYQSRAVIFVHNHPSGDPEPSQDDFIMTHRLKRACDIIGIKALDHIIVGIASWRSIWPTPHGAYL